MRSRPTVTAARGPEPRAQRPLATHHKGPPGDAPSRDSCIGSPQGSATGHTGAARKPQPAAEGSGGAMAAHLTGSAAHWSADQPSGGPPPWYQSCPTFDGASRPPASGPGQHGARGVVGPGRRSTTNLGVTPRPSGRPSARGGGRKPTTKSKAAIAPSSRRTNREYLCLLASRTGAHRGRF